MPAFSKRLLFNSVLNVPIPFSTHNAVGNDFPAAGFGGNCLMLEEPCKTGFREAELFRLMTVEQECQHIVVESECLAITVPTPVCVALNLVHSLLHAVSTPFILHYHLIRGII